MSPEERALRALLAELDRALAQMNTRRSNAITKLGVLLCPLTVGEIIQYKGQDHTVLSIDGNRVQGVYTWDATLKINGTQDVILVDGENGNGW